MYAPTRIHSQPQVANETLHRYIKRFTDLLIKATGTDSTAGTFQMTTVYQTHFKKILKSKFLQQKLSESSQTCKDSNLGSLNKTKQYIRLNDGNPSVMHITAMPHNDQDVMAIQSQINTHNAGSSAPG